jgi:hypothetical protein
MSFQNIVVLTLFMRSRNGYSFFDFANLSFIGKKSSNKIIILLVVTS